MKIVLVGDSIRMGYEPLVRQKVGDRAEVWAPAENCGNSMAHRDRFVAWAIEPKPDVYHFNCGIHDLHVIDLGARFTVSAYARNLRIVVERLKTETNARLIWATSTPMLAPLNPNAKRYPAVELYNAAALRVMEKNGIEVNDLYQAVMDAGAEKCLSEDKVHMAPYGNEVLSDAIVRFIFG